MGDAVRAGRLLCAHGLLPDNVHTSLQRRAIHSADLALAACGRDWIAVHRSWRLNGRHYGALQGKDKAQARAEFSEQQVQLWRRSYAVPPPPAADAPDAPPADAGYTPSADGTNRRVSGGALNDALDVLPARIRLLTEPMDAELLARGEL